ncbi:formylglycine-generating enzyme family protein [Marinomonas sp. M1K-6]|uniref:Formylglycine-generating enzyme family protein n=2 Tax=Marinomonas profundi TaxID=2726122 RepID=A0A847QW94_9GAMM|nr:formylglycine-generating enzyme family protein [Marinomonas profundi]
MQSAKESFEDIREDATKAINDVNANFATKAASLTITATAGYRNAVEKASGGRNTMILDAQGNENIMVVIPRFNCEDINAAVLAATGVDMQLGVGTHPAFRTNGVDRGEILVGKYQASAGVGGGCSVIGGVQPRTSVNYDTAKSMSANKGANWHMMSIHEWAAIALWSLANDTVPRGNTYYGLAHDARHETALRADNGMPGSVSGTPRTDTGSGPVTWAHDHSAYGVQDLVGNVWEWLDQMRLEDGRIITTLDNDPSIVEENWHRHTAYFDSTSSSQSGTGDVGSSILSSTITNRNGPVGNDAHDNPYVHDALFSTIAKDPSYAPNEALRRLLIESAGDTGLAGGLYVRNYGSRFPLRGGNWYNGSAAGLGALNLGNARSFASTSIGFRPALFV